ncbi:MAG TPA: glycine zipper 2TM domain-containing protein, partial [Paracoccaceae bacterium]|nr:glycine zipper 2TM domain-containing protein [Paracoccaceae bacterium]
MSKRLAILAATTALASAAFPASAQDNHEAVADTAMHASHSWADEPKAGVSWDADAPQAEVYEYESNAVVQGYSDEYEAAEYDAGAYGAEAYDNQDRDARPAGYHTARRAMHDRRGPHDGPRSHAPRSQAPRLAYTAAERDEWLAQCRSLHARQESVVYYEDEDDADGGLIGGIIGAVTGGFAGNQIADGDRLLGTIIGAGV